MINMCTGTFVIMCTGTVDSEIHKDPPHHSQRLCDCPLRIQYQILRWYSTAEDGGTTDAELLESEDPGWMSWIDLL
jgi:hypothetical protein